MHPMWNSLKMTFAIWALACALFAQKNHHIALISQVKIPEQASSIWGFTDAKGIEYALLGTFQGLRIFSLENPAKPRELGFIQGPPSAWREIKTSGNYAYITNESGSGLLVVDLSSPQQSLPYRFLTQLRSRTGDTIELKTAHTLFIDEKGWIYLAGAYPVGNGYLVLDPSSSPMDPEVVFYAQEPYCHEVFAYRDTVYAAELFNGVFSITDLKDPAKPIRIIDQPTSGSFTHSVWHQRDRPVLYTADEVGGAVIESWNLSQPGRIQRMGQFRMPPVDQLEIIPHNLFHKNDQLFVSYYTEGVRILDTRDPYNLVEIGGYDTHDQFLEGFHGCWSVFPYFSSGILIASDIENGLFVLKPQTLKASYVYANIRSLRDGLPLYNARAVLQVDTVQRLSYSGIDGIVRTGYATPGKAILGVQYPGYYDFRQEIVLDTANPVVLDIWMNPLPLHTLSLHLTDQHTTSPIPNASVVMFDADTVIRYQTDQNGRLVIQNLYRGIWSISVAKWGHRAQFLEHFNFSGDTLLNWKLAKGYEDDFLHDLGWKSTGQDTNVQWILGDFSELASPFSNFPSKDLPDDTGAFCYYTNNLTRWDTSYSIKGWLRLRSPKMDLEPYGNIQLNYNAWAYGGYQSSKKTYLLLNQHAIQLESIYENLSGQFNAASKFLLDLSGIPRDSSYFEYQLYNHPDSFFQEIKLMAALDGFQCMGFPLQVEQPETRDYYVRTNPVQHTLQLWIPESGSESALEWVMLSASGTVIPVRVQQTSNQVDIDVSHLKAGLYFIGNRKARRAVAFIKI